MMNFNRLMGYLLVPWQPRYNYLISTSLDGRQHFVEVKRLFGLAVVIWLVTIERRFSIGGVGARPIGFGNTSAQCKLLCGATHIRFIASMNFDRFFITFHELLFRNLNWQLIQSLDPIILVLPEVYLAFVLHSLHFVRGCFVAVMAR